MTDHTPTPLVERLRTCGPRGYVLTEAAKLMDEAAARIEELERLEAILESREDVRDGPDGEQLPNEAMSILTEWRGPV